MAKPSFLLRWPFYSRTTNSQSDRSLNFFGASYRTCAGAIPWQPLILPVREWHRRHPLHLSPFQSPPETDCRDSVVNGAGTPTQCHAASPRNNTAGTLLCVSTHGGHFRLGRQTNRLNANRTACPPALLLITNHYLLRAAYCQSSVTGHRVKPILESSPDCTGTRKSPPPDS
jgi:hypothetical protein